MQTPSMQAPVVLSDSTALQDWLLAWRREHERCVAIIDISRYPDADACASALGFDSGTFIALPNLHTRFSHGMKAKGPRLFDAPLDDSRWLSIHREALRAQAATFLLLPEHASPEEHLKQLSTLRQPDGSVTLFRYQDAVVLSALMPLLTEPQVQALLGPAIGWMAMDVCGHPAVLQRKRSDRTVTRPLTLTNGQIELLDRALTPAAIIAQANETDSTLLGDMTRCQQWRTIQLAQERAAQHGLTANEDIALYCVLSLQLPEGFDEDGPVARALIRHRDTRIGFGRAIDEVPVEEWRAWDEVLDKHPSTHRGDAL